MGRGVTIGGCLALAITLAATLGAACGDDRSPAAGAELVDFCTLEAPTAGPTAADLDALEQAAPDEIAGDVATVVTELREHLDDPAYAPSQDVRDAAARVAQFRTDRCTAEVLGEPG